MARKTVAARERQGFAGEDVIVLPAGLLACKPLVDNKWSRQDEAILRAAWGRYRAEDIGRNLNPPRSFDAVYTKARRMGLVG